MKKILALLILGLSPVFCAAEIGEIFYMQGYDDDIGRALRNHPGGRVQAAHHSTGLPEVWIRHLGQEAVKVEYPVDISNKTGLAINGNTKLYQRSSSDSSPCQVTQMQYNKVGFYVNTDQCPIMDIIGGGINLAYQYIWDVNSPRVPMPFKDSSKSMVLQWSKVLKTHNRVPNNPNGAVYQFNVGMAYVDENGRLITTLVGAADSRHTNYIERLNDNDTYVAYTSSSLNTGNQLISINPAFSSPMNATADGNKRFYRVYQSASQLETAINTINSNGGQFTTDISKYRLQGVYLFMEIANIDQGSLEVGGYIEGVLALTCSTQGLAC